MTLTFHPDGRILHNGTEVASPKMSDKFLLSDNISTGYNGDIINWQRPSITNALEGSIGENMSVSSGIFTFPSTGYYLILGQFNILFQGTGDQAANIFLKTTHDNSTYIDYANSWTGDSEGTNQYMMASLNTTLKVTDTSNQKAKFVASSFANTTILFAGTTQLWTFVEFIKLGSI